LADRNHSTGSELRNEIGCSGIVVGHVAVAIPLGLFSGTYFMKRKNPPGEPGAEQNKSAASTAFRTNSDCSIGKSRKSLPKIATVGTKQSDIDAREQRGLGVAFDGHGVRRKLLRPMGP
jgi:hypothetical protein